VLRLLAGLAGIFIVLIGTSLATGALPEKSSVSVKLQSPVSPAVESAATATQPPTGVVEAVTKIPIVKEITKTIESSAPQTIASPEQTKSSLAPLLPPPPPPGPASVNPQAPSTDPVAPTPAPTTQLLKTDDTATALPINPDQGGDICIQAVTAQNFETQDVVDFPSTCAVAPGSRIIQLCPRNLKIPCIAQ
jgi:hypothetical protein